MSLMALMFIRWKKNNGIKVIFILVQVLFTMTKPGTPVLLRWD